MARKSEIIQKIDRINIVTPKLPLMRFLRRFAISLGLIPKILIKNEAWSGWKTIYAKKLPKNIITTKRIAPINFIKVEKEIGSRVFFGPWTEGTSPSGKDDALILDSSVVGRSPLKDCEWSISERREMGISGGLFPISHSGIGFDGVDSDIVRSYFLQYIEILDFRQKNSQ